MGNSSFSPTKRGGGKTLSHVEEGTPTFLGSFNTKYLSFIHTAQKGSDPLIRDPQPMSCKYDSMTFQTEVNTGGPSQRLMLLYGKL